MPAYRTFTQHLDPSYKPKRILALDGGGIRGLLTAGLLQRLEDILRAAGAEEVMTVNRYAHLVGGCRMAAGERSGVVDADLRTFAVPNLSIIDGSVLPTQGAANPAITIMALAARAADRLVAGSRNGRPVGTLLGP